MYRQVLFLNDCLRGMQFRLHLNYRLWSGECVSQLRECNVKYPALIYVERKAEKKEQRASSSNGRFDNPKVQIVTVTVAVLDSKSSTKASNHEKRA